MFPFKETVAPDWRKAVWLDRAYLGKEPLMVFKYFSCVFDCPIRSIKPRCFKEIDKKCQILYMQGHSKPLAKQISLLPIGWHFFSQTFFYIFMQPIKTFGNMARRCLANLSLLFAHFLEYSHYCLKGLCHQFRTG